MLLKSTLSCNFYIGIILKCNVIQALSSGMYTSLHVVLLEITQCFSSLL